MESRLLTTEEKEELLKKALVDKEIITQDQLDAVISSQADLISKAREEIGGIVFSIDQEKYKLIASDFLEKDELFSIDMSAGIDLAAIKDIDWDNRGTDIALFDIETCKKLGDIPFSQDLNYGFVINKDKHYYYNQEMETYPYLGILSNYFFGGIPKTKIPALPLDLFISPSKKLMVISDRSSGKIHIIDIPNKKLMGTIAVRVAGSAKAINIAIAENKKKIYATDNQSSAITVIDLNTMKSARQSASFGILGNIVLTPDEKSMFLVVIKPVFALKLVDSEKFIMQKDFPLKGDTFSNSTDDPVDLMTVSPDGKNLIFMTYLNDPTPFLPIITVIDIEKQKTTQRFSIKDGTKPVSLGFGIPNPIYNSKRELKDLLLEKELITPVQLNELLRAIILEAQGGVEEKPEEKIVKVETQEIDIQAMQALKPQEEEDEEEDDIKIVPKKAPFLNISPAADELISDICIGLFYQQTDINLEEIPEAMARIKSAAAKARQELEWHDCSIIKISNLHENKRLKTVITRESIEEMLRTAEFDELVKQGLKTVHQNCPNCDQPLLGSYVCRACGYEIEKPEDAILESGVTKIASLDPLANLQRGHFLVVDVLKSRILEVDTRKSISWEYSTNAIFGNNVVEIKFPRDATRLKNRNTLIADIGTNKVMEVTPKGRIYWEFDRSFTLEHPLDNPVRAVPLENRNVIVVDKGHHRLIEIDRDQFVQWQYGKMGEAGIEPGFLCDPSDVQRFADGQTLITDSGNNRVIRLEKDNIVWQYGNADNESRGGAGNGENQLFYPVSAFEFSDTGNVLIVDAGNMRVIEVTDDKRVVWEYKTSEGEDKNIVGEPIRAIRLKNFNILIIGESNVIEVEKENNKVVWQCTIANLNVTKLFSVQEVTHKKANVKHGTSNPYMRMKAPEEAGKESAQDKLKALIERQKGKIGVAASDKAHVSVTPGAVLSEDLEIVLVERTRNRVIKADRKGMMKFRFGEDAEKLNHPHQAELLPNNRILIADSDRFRVIEVDLSNSQIVWQFGTTDVKGTEKEQLGQVRHAIRLPNGNTLIADVNRGLEVTPDKEIIWSYRNWEVLNASYYIDRTPTGTNLITDWGNHIVIEVNKEGEVVWQYGTTKKAGKDKGQLMYPECAIRLKTGNTLIADTRNNRVIEVTPEGETIFEYIGEGIQKLASPTYVKRLDDGHTVIIHSTNRQILEVDSTGKLLWKYMLPFEKK